VCVKLWGVVNTIPLNGGVTITLGRGSLIPLYGGVAEGRGGHDITRLLLFFFNTIPPHYYTHTVLLYVVFFSEVR
jgi:hypothetical protein